LKDLEGAIVNDLSTVMENNNLLVRFNYFLVRFIKLIICNGPKITLVCFSRRYLADINIKRKVIEQHFKNVDYLNHSL
jgi:hypothetical protein